MKGKHLDLKVLEKIGEIKEFNIVLEKIENNFFIYLTSKNHLLNTEQITSIKSKNKEEQSLLNFLSNNINNYTNTLKLSSENSGLIFSLIKKGEIDLTYKNENLQISKKHIKLSFKHFSK